MKGASAAGARKDDIARRVADKQGADDGWRCGGKVNDTDAVRQMVDDPNLCVACAQPLPLAPCPRLSNVYALDPPAVTSNTSKWLSGVFTASKVEPSGVNIERPHLAAFKVNKRVGRASAAPAGEAIGKHTPAKHAMYRRARWLLLASGGR